MPFKKLRFTYVSRGHVHNEPRLVRDKNNSFHIEYQNPCDIILPVPQESDIGALLEAGAKIVTQRTALLEPSMSRRIVDDDIEPSKNENPKKDN